MFSSAQEIDKLSAKRPITIWVLCKPDREQRVLFWTNPGIPLETERVINAYNRGKDRSETYMSRKRVVIDISSITPILPSFIIFLRLRDVTVLIYLIGEDKVTGSACETEVACSRCREFSNQDR